LVSGNAQHFLGIGIRKQTIDIRDTELISVYIGLRFHRRFESSPTAKYFDEIIPTLAAVLKVVVATSISKIKAKVTFPAS
jgi:hypothetical protein